jgi:MFS family permease
MDRYFDVIYYSLAIGILLALAYSSISALYLRRSSDHLTLRKRALGIIWIALGTAIALLGGLFADSFLKNSAYFQQVRFALYDAGFALIVLGFTTILVASQVAYAMPRYLSNTKQVRYLVWFLFLGAMVVSTFFLLDPITFIRNQFGFQTQQSIYFLPLLIAVFAGSVLLYLFALGIQERAGRSPLLWLAAYAVLVFVGLLRESLILPDLGDPLIDLLVAFVPFLLGSICLSLAAIRFRRLAT